MSKDAPTRRTRARRQTGAQPVDESNWRASRIGLHEKISKTYAMKQYRVSAREIVNLKYQKEPTVKFDRRCTMYLYKEREVEYIAWVKYGGPEAFEALLDAKREEWEAAGGFASGKEFHEPRPYAPANPGVSIAFFPPSPAGGRQVSRYDAATSNLLTMKQELKAAGHEWLWKALIDEYRGPEEYSVSGDSPNKREEEAVLMQAKTRIIPGYPPRMKETLLMTCSASFKALVDVLARAAVWPGEDKITNTTIQELDVTFDGFSHHGEVAEWRQEYLDEVYDGLVNIVAEHGLAGWQRARWKVYDKYVECNLGGPKYVSDGPNDHYWSDMAVKWLYAEQYDTMNQIKKKALLDSLR